MFEQTFKNIDDLLYKDAGADSELDYIGQTSWILFLRYLDELELDKKDEADDEPGILRGTPCAPGVARGRVRILRSMTDTNALQPGEVMVATTTNPSFTPLFSTIAALLTLTGGKLSHGAVVAREYRIPAVLGVKDIFDKLSNGQLVEVDGTAGTIRLIDAQEANA